MSFVVNDSTTVKNQCRIRIPSTDSKLGERENVLSVVYTCITHGISRKQSYFNNTDNMKNMEYKTTSSDTI